ncbi:FHA domain-containing protein [Nostoc sp. FACHB-110]|uniref:FHA domain-containing protein n=1 Tax=Nostoc sp. FACHB-110 TaxID=2692834 RepID=UPI0016835A3B|nr:FHA domain-containing protein [Nostoc sp. FACHB-110]MBD2435964.1 FHA domain-containing protein [Nostoc sp. FACHB-110]
MTEISKSNLLALKDSASNVAEFQAKEIEKKLSLYQEFVKLYEHNSRLLEDILEIEKVSQPGLTRFKPSYVQGIIDDSVVYLVTNLGENHTEALLQPQRIWTLGRDRHNGIYVANKYLSRRHAAIQYIDNNDAPGFYLVDFKSTNGSFVNGERVYHQIKLQDGDRIRLGNLTFDFFCNQTCRVLPTVAMELLMQLAARKGCANDETVSYVAISEQYLPATNKPITFPHNLDLDHQHNADNLSTEQKADILDRFFNKFTPYSV